MLDRADGYTIAVADRCAQARIDDIVVMRLDLNICAQIRTAKDDSRIRRCRAQSHRYFSIAMKTYTGAVNRRFQSTLQEIGQKIKLSILLEPHSCVFRFHKL